MVRPGVEPPPLRHPCRFPPGPTSSKIGDPGEATERVGELFDCSRRLGAAVGGAPSLCAGALHAAVPHVLHADAVARPSPEVHWRPARPGHPGGVSLPATSHLTNGPAVWRSG